MRAPGTGLIALKRQRPEWGPWLAVVEQILREAATLNWDATVPGAEAQRAKAAPLLAGATVSVPAASVRRLLERLIHLAVRSGTPKMMTLAAARGANVDGVSLFTASVRHEPGPVAEVAARCAADAEALQAVVALLAVPFLQACNRRWASVIPKGWVEGYCPVSGSWPAFAEVRGIERSRFFRCGRCGGEWHAQPLSCPYCSLNDHNQLVALVPEKNESHGVVDACKRCLGYVKTFTTLQGCAATGVMLEDLATVALDVAVIEQGYIRRADAGYRLDVTVVSQNAPRPWATKLAERRRRFFAWNA